MKNLLIILMLLCAASLYANDSIKVTKVNNTFSYVVKNSKEKAIKTAYFFEVKGIKYPIYKTSKACFIIRISSKSNKEYKQYLSKEIFNSL